MNWVKPDDDGSILILLALIRVIDMSAETYTAKVNSVVATNSL